MWSFAAFFIESSKGLFRLSFCDLLVDLRPFVRVPDERVFLLPAVPTVTGDGAAKTSSKVFEDANLKNGDISCTSSGMALISSDIHLER